MRLTALQRPVTAVLVALALAASACASSEGSEDQTTNTAGVEPIDTNPVDTDPPSTVVDDPLDVDFASEPIDAGPLLGSGTAAEMQDAVDGVEPNDPNSQPVDTTPPFIPADEDAPFCTLLDDLSERPFPSDDTEALQVASVWFGELVKVAVPTIAEDLGLMLQAIDDVIAAQGDIEDVDAGLEANEAADRVNLYVNQKCEGLTGTTTSPVEPDPDPDNDVEPTTDD